jgi:alkyl hydroperoxide reductase subunit D
MTLDQLFEGFESPTELDFKVNFKKFLIDSKLEPKTAGLVALSCAETLDCDRLIRFSQAFASEHGAHEADLLEASDVAAVMGIANNYYRFRHFVSKEAYQKPAGFRMSLMGKPVTGKLNLELMALAVSIINGCENCVQGHEKSVLEHGGTEEMVHDTARLASTINGLAVLFRRKLR